MNHLIDRNCSRPYFPGGAQLRRASRDQTAKLNHLRPIFGFRNRERLAIREPFLDEELSGQRIQRANFSAGTAPRLEAGAVMSWDLPPVTKAIAHRFARSYPSTTAVGQACKQGRGQSVRLGPADVLRQPLPGVTTVSFALITGLFAAIYKMMPRAKIAWRDVWIGAVVTALLFTAGKFLIGLYLGKSGVTSAFGAAGSMVVLLIWVYYSAQIFLLGAEFTRVYARHSGSRVSAPQEQPASSMPQSTVGFVTRESASTTSAFHPATGQELPPRRKSAAPFGRRALLSSPGTRCETLEWWSFRGFVVGTILRRFVPLRGFCIGLRPTWRALLQGCGTYAAVVYSAAYRASEGAAGRVSPNNG